MQPEKYIPTLEVDTASLFNKYILWKISMYKNYNIVK
jgi:hypothetical protein